MTATTEICDDCTLETPCSAHPWPGLAAGRPRAGQGIGMSALDVALPASTLIRILAVLDDAEQVYADLTEAGAAMPWNADEAAALTAMYAELDALRCGSGSVSS